MFIAVRTGTEAGGLQDGPSVITFAVFTNILCVAFVNSFAFLIQ